MKEFFSGKTILVTGATGSIGSQLLRKLVSLEPKSIIAFSRDDSKQFYLQQELREHTNIEYVIGDVRDLRAVERVFDNHIDVVFHAAETGNTSRDLLLSKVNELVVYASCFQDSIDKLIHTRFFFFTGTSADP